MNVSFLLQDSEHLITLAHLSDYNVYRIPNAKRVFGAPFEWGACLRPNSNAEAEHTEAGEPGIKVITFENEKSRTCWLTAMRLAKVSNAIPLLRSVLFHFPHEESVVFISAEIRVHRE